MMNLSVNLRKISKKIIATAAGLVCTAVLLFVPATYAAQVDDLYTAEAELADAGAGARAEAFSSALSQVLVKVTGQTAVVEQQAEIFPDAAVYAQQYRKTGRNRLRVSFDPEAIRQRLDAAGLPIWGAERPTMLVWLAIDEGQGRRSLLSAGNTPDAISDADEYRDALISTAEARGLPLLLPLVDAEDLSLMSTSDVWGGFGDALTEASKRYSADVILLGRLRQAGAEGAQVRWSLFISGIQRSEWEGGVADGPSVAADILAQELATYAASSDAITLTVRDVETLDQYAKVLSYLRSLSIVEHAGVSRVLGNAVEFAITARADAERLDRDIKRGRVLTEWQPEVAAGEQQDWMDFRVSDNLTYTLKSGW